MLDDTKTVPIKLTARLQHQKGFYEVASFTVNTKILYLVTGVPTGISSMLASRMSWETILLRILSVC